MSSAGEDAEQYGTKRASRLFERHGTEGSCVNGVTHVEVRLREKELARLLEEAYLDGWRVAQRLMGP